MAFSNPVKMITGENDLTVYSLSVAQRQILVLKKAQELRHSHVPRNAREKGVIQSPTCEVEPPRLSGC